MWCTQCVLSRLEYTDGWITRFVFLYLEDPSADCQWIDLVILLPVIIVLKTIAVNRISLSAVDVWI